LKEQKEESAIKVARKIEHHGMLKVEEVKVGSSILHRKERKAQSELELKT